MPDHMEQIQQCRGYYERKAKHTPLDGTEAWALQHLDAHERLEGSEDALSSYGMRRLIAIRHSTESLHRHLFGEVE